MQQASIPMQQPWPSIHSPAYHANRRMRPTKQPVQPLLAAPHCEQTPICSWTRSQLHVTAACQCTTALTQPCLRSMMRVDHWHAAVPGIGASARHRCSSHGPNRHDRHVVMSGTADSVFYSASQLSSASYDPGPDALKQQHSSSQASSSHPHEPTRTTSPNSQQNLVAGNSNNGIDATTSASSTSSTSASSSRSSNSASSSRSSNSASSSSSSSDGAPTTRSSSPHPPQQSWSLSSQRSQVRWSILIMAIPLPIAVLHVCTAVLDTVQSGSLFAVVYLFQMLDQLVSGMPGGSQGLPGAGGVDVGAGLGTGLGTGFDGVGEPASGSDLMPSETPGDIPSGPPESVQGDMLPIPGAGESNVHAGNMTDDDMGVARQLVTLLLALQSLVLEVWNAAFDTEAWLVGALMWLEDVWTGRLISITMRSAVTIWALHCSVYSFMHPLRFHIASTLEHVRATITAQLKAAAAGMAAAGVAAWAAAQQVVSTPAETTVVAQQQSQSQLQQVQSDAAKAVAMISSLTGVTSNTPSQKEWKKAGRTTPGRMSRGQANKGPSVPKRMLAQVNGFGQWLVSTVMGAGQAVLAGLVMAGRVMASSPAILPVCPAADTAMRAAVGLCVASGNIVTVSSSAPAAALLGLASTGLAAVQIIALVVYIFQALSHSSTRFFTEHRDDVILQVSVLIMAQSFVHAAILGVETCHAPLAAKNRAAAVLAILDSGADQAAKAAASAAGTAGTAVATAAAGLFPADAAVMNAVEPTALAAVASQVPWYAWGGPLYVVASAVVAVMLLREKRFSPTDIVFLMILLVLG